jgi:hypothetical protein
VRTSPLICRYTRVTAAALLSVAALLWVSPCGAQQVRVTRITCASGVHLTVRDAPLSEVLQRMATALNFQLRFESAADPRVSFDATAQPGDLVTRLTGAVNVSTILRHNPRCPGRNRLVYVWVLPASSGGAVVAARNEPPRNTPMQDWQVEQGIEAHLRAHGLSPATP